MYLRCRTGAICHLASCDCDAQLSYTRPDLLERSSRYAATDTAYEVYLYKTFFGEHRYSYYSKDKVTWSEALNRNKDNEAYTNSTAIINMIKAGIHLKIAIRHFPTKRYDYSYWIELGSYTCSSGKYT